MFKPKVLAITYLLLVPLYIMNIIPILTKLKSTNWCVAKALSIYNLYLKI